ncbi:MAG TPA: CBS domain-containing protein [Thermoanaerobaculia bacterium]|nr:CBS domain-containing protein [Thermoanaerobaculia bacterium]
MIETARVPVERSLIDARVLRICAWSVALALITGFVAQALCWSSLPSAASSSASWRDGDRKPSADTASLPVVDRDDPTKLVGIITRSDLLKIHARRLEEEHG